jgi:hypothetical protein
LKLAHLRSQVSPDTWRAAKPLEIENASSTLLAF